MSDDKENLPPSGFKAQGLLTEKGVKIVERSSIDALAQRGYGAVEKEALMLTFYETLFLFDRQVLCVKDNKNSQLDFQRLLQAYEEADENAWMHYLVYRDLRTRGYVVREGFGAAIDFRIYERGSYGKDTAASLVLSTQEGQPLLLGDLSNALSQTQSLKKDLVLAVINRRGEIVYYSVSPLTFQ